MQFIIIFLPSIRGRGFVFLYNLVCINHEASIFVLKDVRIYEMSFSGIDL